MSGNIQELRNLSPILINYIEREARQRSMKAGDDPFAGLGLTRAAMMRGGLHFHHHVSGDPADIENGAGNAFILSWMLAERETFRRIMAAISTPAARGREAEVVKALMGGASIDDALRPRRTDADAFAHPDKGITVIPLKPNGGPR
jgi:hypothetical protein